LETLVRKKLGLQVIDKSMSSMPGKGFTLAFGSLLPGMPAGPGAPAIPPIVARLLPESKPVGMPVMDDADGIEVEP
jgi:hypothetical protein